MRQIQLIYLHVKAKRQLINRFRHRTSHNHNFNWHTFPTSNLFVSGEVCNCNIEVNSQIQCSHVIQTQVHQLWRMHIYFWFPLPRWQFAHEERKTQTEIRHLLRWCTIYTFAHTQSSLQNTLNIYWIHFCVFRLMWRSASEECTFRYLVKKGYNYLRPCQSDSINLTITCLRWSIFK